MPADPQEGILTSLAHDDADVVREAVAGNQGTPIDVLRLLADDTEDQVRASLAANRATPVDVLRFLSNDFLTRVRRALAGYEWKEEDSGDMFMSERCDQVLFRPKNLFNLGNPSVPADVLTVLSTDKDIGVQSGVAGNAATPTGLLRKLAGISDCGDYVLLALASNASIPEDVLRRLVRESYDPQEGWYDFGERAFAAQNPAAPLDLLRAFSTDKDGDVREGAARNPATPVECLRSLARDENENVRRDVADNPSTPRECLRALANDKDYQVVWRAAENSGTPSESLAALAADSSAHCSSVAGNSSTPVDVLIRPSASADRMVRLCVAKNPATRSLSCGRSQPMKMVRSGATSA